MGHRGRSDPGRDAPRGRPGAGRGRVSAPTSTPTTPSPGRTAPTTWRSRTASTSTDGGRDLRPRDRAGPRQRGPHAPLRPGDPLLVLGHHRRGLPACPAARRSRSSARATGRISVAVAGEGAANQGAFHESLNLAALWRLPVVFVIEDNDWAISVPRSASRPRSRRTPSAPRATASPVCASRATTSKRSTRRRGEAVARARAGQGPQPAGGPHGAALGALRGRRPGLSRQRARHARRARPDPAVRSPPEGLGVLDDDAVGRSRRVGRRRASTRRSRSPRPAPSRRPSRRWKTCSLDRRR